ncbi:hypothetical protein GCM10023321_57110 [Pseudonocardia eucalypti]|uniref:Uncharacterized protein n=1 Tax=Pseudonocardia eucalypti TaxID=648755 RepID=A0ABP9QS69_9PSEU|nr:hypothetical protein [Pseudonocardia eucalypti]
MAPGSFSLFTIGMFPRGAQRARARVLSFMATGSFDGEVAGINDGQRAEEQRFGRRGRGAPKGDVPSRAHARLLPG